MTKCLWKKPGLKTCGNLRPIALQNSIFPLPSKMLAKRLAVALKKNKAMDPAQEAFLIGGKASNAIWTLLGLYEHADVEDKDIFVVFYDWAKAYDTLPWYAVEMGMRRLGLPDQFIEYVLCSLKGSSTSYRTAYGNTSTVYMMRGVKQGDPLAPLLYIIVMDILHTALRKKGKGYAHGDEMISSEGYADDTALIADVWENLVSNHDTVLDLCSFFSIAINHTKSQLTGRLKGGNDLCRPLNMPDGRVVPPVGRNQACKYLGVWIAADGNWKKQKAVLTYMVEVHCAAIRYSVLKLDEGIRIVNEYLMPKLNYRTAFMRLDKGAMGKWQNNIELTVALLDRGTTRISKAALAVGMGLQSVMDQAMAQRVEGMVEKINGNGFLGTISRSTGNWPSTGPVDPKKLKGTLKYEAKLTEEMGLSILARWRGVVPHRVLADEGKHTMWNVVTNGCDTEIPRKLTGTWGKNDSPTQWDLYVDGSFVKEEGSAGIGSWGVVVGNDWLNENWQKQVAQASSVAIEDHLGARRLVAYSGLCQDEVEASFDPELTAVAMALQVVPLTGHATVHIDNMAALKSIGAYANELSEVRRRKFVMAEVQNVIWQIMESRKACGAHTTFEHVKAHETVEDVRQAGNKVADLVAKRGSLRCTGHVLDRDWGAERCAIRLPGGTAPRLPAKRLAQQVIKARWVAALKGGNSQNPHWESQSLGSWASCMSRDGHKKGLLVRLATNTLFKEDYTAIRPKGRVDCPCGEDTMTSNHVWSCPDMARERKSWLETTTRILEEKDKEWRPAEMPSKHAVKVTAYNRCYRRDPRSGLRDAAGPLLATWALRGTSLSDKEWQTGFTTSYQDFRTENPCDECSGRNHSPLCGMTNQTRCRPVITSKIKYLFGLRGEILTRAVQADKWSDTLFSEKDAEMRLGAEGYPGQGQGVLWQWSESAKRPVSSMFGDVLELEDRGSIGWSVGLILTGRDLEKDEVLMADVEVLGTIKGSLSNQQNIWCPITTPKKIWIVLRAGPEMDAKLIPMGGMLSVIRDWMKPGSHLDEGKWKSLWVRLGFGFDGNLCHRWAREIPMRMTGDRNFYGKWNRDLLSSLGDIGILKGRRATIAEISSYTVSLMITYYNKVKEHILLPARVGGGSRDAPVLFDLEDDDLGQHIWEVPESDSEEESFPSRRPQDVSRKYGKREAQNSKAERDWSDSDNDW